MSQRETEWTQRIRHALDAELARPDPALSAALARRRALALSQARGTRTGLRAYTPGIAFATAAIAVVMLAGLPQTARNIYDNDSLLLEVARLNADIELIEDLDFYHWLDANGYAG
tara:strand:+ start:895 stop:1239 length:345 start_codon:yes stop_codon:yes gene_type:complete